MKKTTTGKYLGCKNSGYLFEVDGRIQYFDKCDREIVVKYDLTGLNFLNRLFSIEYWDLFSTQDLQEKQTKIITLLRET